MQNVGNSVIKKRIMQSKPNVITIVVISTYLKRISMKKMNV